MFNVYLQKDAYITDISITLMEVQLQPGLFQTATGALVAIILQPTFCPVPASFCAPCRFGGKSPIQRLRHPRESHLDFVVSRSVLFLGPIQVDLEKFLLTPLQADYVGRASYFRDAAGALPAQVNKPGIPCWDVAIYNLSWHLVIQ